MYTLYERFKKDLQFGTVFFLHKSKREHQFLVVGVVDFLFSA